MNYSGKNITYEAKDIFLVAHASGNIYLYNKHFIEEQPFAPCETKEYVCGTDDWESLFTRFR